MALKLYIILALSGAAFAGISPHYVQEVKLPVTQDTVLANFLCPGSGVFPHPDTCSAFVSCTDNLLAYEVQCPEGLHFVIASSPNDASCDLPEIAKCDSGVTPDTTTTSTTTTTTASPPPPPPPISPPKPGDPCEPEKCTEIGYCLNFFVCNKKTAKWEEKECGKNLWWNPLAANSSIHGGTCDEYDNLPEDIKAIYLADTVNCICPCEWFQQPDQFCTEYYFYRRPFDNFTSNDADRVEELKCPPGLVWLGHEKLTCGRCEDAVKQNGYPCC